MYSRLRVMSERGTVSLIESTAYKLGLQVYVQALADLTGVRVFLEGRFELWMILQLSQ